MASGDNKCAACGRWAGRGHRCEAVIPNGGYDVRSMDATDRISEAQHLLTGTNLRPEIADRVSRAQALLAEAQELLDEEKNTAGTGPTAPLIQAIVRRMNRNQLLVAYEVEHEGETVATVWVSKNSSGQPTQVGYDTPRPGGGSGSVMMGWQGDPNEGITEIMREFAPKEAALGRRYSPD